MLRPRLVPAAFLLAGGLASAAAVAAEERPSRGERLALEGRCPAALIELEAEQRAEPADGRLALLAGECRLRLRQYARAERDFERALALDASLPRADLGLAVARYHQGDLEGAAAELRRAELKLPRSAEVTLYWGLVHLAAGRSALAADYLDRSRRLDPRAVEPVATYHLGLALEAQGDHEAARRELEAVVREWAGSEWAAEARRALERLESEEPTWWAAARAGVEFDDNVVLRGDGVPLGQDVSGASDVLGVWTLSGGARLFAGQEWSGGLNVAYDGSAHRDLRQFDVEAPGLGAWLDRRLGDDTLARGTLDFGYAWVDEKPFLATWGATLSLHHRWEAAGTTHLAGGSWFENDFAHSDRVPDADPRTGRCEVGTEVCGPAGLDERSARNRDGVGFHIGVEHEPPLQEPAWLERWLVRPTLSAGYRYDAYDSRGREYSYEAHEVHLRAGAGLPLGLRADVFTSFTYRPFRHGTTFPDPDAVPPAYPVVPGDPSTLTGSVYALPGGHRREREVRVEVGLSRTFLERFTLAGRWRYVRNHSSAAVYDYDRQVFGIDLRVAFGG